MKYNEKVLNEFYNPQNVGVIRGANGKGKIVDPINREIMKIFISLDGEKIVNAEFQTFGCPPAIACCSVATRLIIGKTLSEAEKITEKEILSELDSLPENKMKYLKMAVDTVKDAVDACRNKGKRNKDEDDD